MTTDRSYRRALPHEVAVAELHANAGTQFDPAVVDALTRVVHGAAAAVLPLPAPSVSRESLDSAA